MIKFTNAILRRIEREGGNKMLQQHTSTTDNLSTSLLNELYKCWGKDRTRQIIDNVLGLGVKQQQEQKVQGINRYVSVCKTRQINKNQYMSCIASLFPILIH